MASMASPVCTGTSVVMTNGKGMLLQAPARRFRSSDRRVGQFSVLGAVSDECLYPERPQVCESAAPLTKAGRVH
jgi:hypothetical protein